MHDYNIGYRTRARSLTSVDANKKSKKSALQTLDETKELLINDLKQQKRQKKKSKSDGGIFEDLETDTLQPSKAEMESVKQDQLVNQIKDEIQAWVIPQVQK